MSDRAKELAAAARAADRKLGEAERELDAAFLRFERWLEDEELFWEEEVCLGNSAVSLRWGPGVDPDEGGWGLEIVSPEGNGRPLAKCELRLKIAAAGALDLLRLDILNRPHNRLKEVEAATKSILATCEEHGG